MPCSFFLSLGSEYCKDVFHHTGFEQLDVEICNKLWKEDEFSDDSKCDGDMVVKFLSDSEQSYSSHNESNVKDDSDMSHGAWTKVGDKQPHFPVSHNLI
jgi:hypothetical protein